MRRNKGFTLLEVLIALFIFTIVSMILVHGLHTVFTAQSATEKSAERLAKVQIALTILSRDFEQTIDRPITNATGAIENSFIGFPTQVIFTHGGLVNPMNQLKRSTLQRVRYRLENGSLIRDTWEVLDQTPESTPNSRRLLSDVAELHFEFLDKDGKFQNKWPPPDMQPNAVENPRAVRVFIRLNNWGKITQFYLITGQKFAKPS
jgi:general secretion pathway protein J